MTTSLNEEVYQQLRSRKSERVIKNDLVDRGYTEEYAEKLIADVKQQMPALRAAERHTARNARKEEQRGWGKTTVGGVITCVLSVVFLAAVLGLFALGPFGWGFWEDERWMRAPFGVAFLGFLGGLLAIAKGMYHRIRWW